METLNSPSINLPIDLILESLRGTTVKPTNLRTFLYLKLFVNDRFILDDRFISDFSKFANIHPKTCKTHLKLLVKHNFLGYNSKNRRVFIRSIYTLRKCPTTKYHINVSFNHLEFFQELLLSAVVAYRCRIYIHKKAKPELINGGSLQGLVRQGKILHGYAPLAVSYLSRIMNRSSSWVDRVKQSAIKRGFIQRKRDYMDTNFLWSERLQVLQANNLDGRSKKVNDQLVFVGIDLIESQIGLRKKRG